MVKNTKDSGSNWEGKNYPQKFTKEKEIDEKFEKTNNGFTIYTKLLLKPKRGIVEVLDDYKKDTGLTILMISEVRYNCGR